MVFLKIVSLSCLLLAFASTPLRAEESDKDPFSGISVSKAELAKTLEDFKKQGKISEADYNKSLTDLNAMSDNQVLDLNKKGMDEVKNNPENAEAMAKMKKIGN